jgi:hypothetical protein
MTSILSTSGEGAPWRRCRKGRQRQNEHFERLPDCQSTSQQQDPTDSSQGTGMNTEDRYSEGQHVEHTEDEMSAMSRRVNLKMDIALLPFLALLYLFNGLDRSNVGNAETNGRLQVPTSQNSDSNHSTRIYSGYWSNSG